MALHILQLSPALQKIKHPWNICYFDFKLINGATRIGPYSSVLDIEVKPLTES